MVNNQNTIPRKKGRFNVVDLLIIFLILSVAFGAFWYVDPFAWFQPAEQEQVATLIYVIELTDVDSELRYNVTAGKQVREEKGSVSLGVIKTVKYQQSFNWVPSESDGTMVQLPNTGKHDIFVTVEVNATYEKDRGYFVDGKQIAVGAPIKLTLDNFEAQGYCISMEIVK